MLAIDTNVVVRYLTGDHPSQSAHARALIDGQPIVISTTVLLETEWVLRSVYGYEPVQLLKAIRAFAGLPSVTIHDPPLAAQALDWMEGGMDLADALHLAEAAGSEAFVTFDRRLVTTAKKLGVTGVRTP